jgi:thiosulfate/3-mercaptopyruvate sulfurtransferase
VPVPPEAVGAVDRAWVRDRFGTPEVELVDLRSDDAWAAGHLPHSLPFDFRELLEDDGAWPDPVAARRTLGRLGPRPNTHVDLNATMVVYSSGVGASGDDGRQLGLAYLLLRMTGVPAAVYPGGWEDWRSEPSSPVVRVVDAAGVRELLAAANPELADRPVPGVTLLDVRGELDFRARHLPGAVEFPSRNCPETDWSVVPEPPSGDRLDAPLVFYCYGRTCIRSRNCSTAAARAGFREVLWFRDGVPDWYEAGLPFYRVGKPGETATRLP